MNSGCPKYRMRIDLNVLNHLGMNLYSNVPAVLSEIVANSWDADAENVYITINSNEENPNIIIEDDGHGMTLSEINKKFLTVGYAKREDGVKTTVKFVRPVMGRKGIGKLSLFSIANVIDIYTTKDDETNGFRLDSKEIRKAIGNETYDEYQPEDLPIDDINLIKGTRIVLSSIKKKRLNAVDTFLRKRLARRFSILGKKHSFNLNLNGIPITIEDRDYFKKIEYLWYYGEESKHFGDFCSNAVKVEKRENLLNGGHKISGWLGLTKESGQLQDGDENLNKIVLLMRGKMAKEDILEEFREGGLFTKYLFGEITADFLDDSDKPDIATSSRQDIFEEDDRYNSLTEFIKKELKHISKKRAEYKGKKVEDDILKMPAISDWYSDLSRDTKSKAKKFFGRINQIVTDKEHKKQLFTHGVIAFESYRYKDSLDALNTISTENLDEFLSLFKEFDEIESTLFYKITKERLAIIGKLKEHVHDDNSLEKILQNHLFDSLWLLDPSWERSTDSTPYMEQRLRTEFGDIRAKLSEEEDRGRVDIKYKTPAGKHVLIELKRASVSTDTLTLLAQVDKYRNGLEKILLEISPKQVPVIEAVCVVGKKLKDWTNDHKINESIKTMEAKSTRVVTYQQLIENAYKTYSEYLNSQRENVKLIKVLENFEIQLDQL